MQVTVVNERNVAVGSVSEQELYEKKLNHRVAHVVAVNNKGEVFLTQLPASEKFCPGHWCTSAHGIVLDSETYEQTAVRQAKDWLGTAAPLTKVHDGTYDHYKMRKFIEVFRVQTNNILLNPEKAMDGKWFSIRDVKEMVRKHELVHPELAYVMEELYP